MKLAIRKEESSIPGAGFHYFLYPMAMENDVQAKFFEMMGHLVVEVSEDEGRRLIQDAGKALHHQVEIAFMADAREKLRGKV